MAERRTWAEAWREYRVSKTALFISCIACVVIVLVIGFNWGGWVTEGAAKRMAEQATQDGRAELAASICVDRFMNSASVRKELTSLKETSVWQRDDFIAEGGWIDLPGVESLVPGAADECAQRLAEMQPPTNDKASPTGEKSTTVQ